MAKGLTIFACIDHAAGAAQVGLPLRATTILDEANAHHSRLITAPKLKLTARIEAPDHILSPLLCKVPGVAPTIADAWPNPSVP
jgi:hypothetical protein